MVCQHRALRSQEAGISRLEAELVSLFGREVVAEASRADPEQLEVDAELVDEVHHAADELLRHRYPKEQRQVVAGLEPRVRLLLCLWVRDIGLAGAIMDRVLTVQR